MKNENQKEKRKRKPKWKIKNWKWKIKIKKLKTKNETVYHKYILIFEYLNIMQFAKNKYICYSSSVLFWTTNIFDIRIWSAVGIWIYLIFLFGKIFHKYALIYTQAAEILGHLHKYESKLVWNLFYGGGSHQKFVFIFSIFVFGWVSKNEYI